MVNGRSVAGAANEHPEIAVDSNMRRSTAALGSLLFFLIVPGTVAGVVPWALTRWEVETPLLFGPLQRVAGGLLVFGGASVLIHAVIRFAVEGLGTPAPTAPTTHLVVGGLYRYVRNPMYLAVLAVVSGQALIFGQGSLGLYASFLVVAFVLFVRFYEEPTLAARYGADYDAYRRAVPAWWPRRPGPPPIDH